MGSDDHATEFVAALLLARPDEVRQVAWLTEDALPDPVLSFVYRAARHCATHEPGTYSPQAVLDQVRRHGASHHMDAVVALVGATTGYASLPWLAERLAEGYGLARIRAATDRVRQIVAADLGEDERRRMLVEQATAILDHAAPAGPGLVVGLHRVADFLTTAEEAGARWLVPRFLGKGERWMCLATPGAGKSVLARQLCLGLAGGVHPLWPTMAVPPRRTLMIDLENPADLLRDELARQSRQVAGIAQAADLAWLWHQPGGIDLADPADLRSFHQVIDSVQPDLVALAPVYKAHSASSDSWEMLAATVTSAVDSVRARSDVTFWLEHHASKAGTTNVGLDPFGSSRWSRWPDFVIGLLRPSDDKDASGPPARLLWRVQKARDWQWAWPSTLVRDARWSWAGHYPNGFDDR